MPGGRPPKEGEKMEGRITVRLSDERRRALELYAAHDDKEPSTLAREFIERGLEAAVRDTVQRCPVPPGYELGFTNTDALNPEATYRTPRDMFVTCRFNGPQLESMYFGNCGDGTVWVGRPPSTWKLSDDTVIEVIEIRGGTGDASVTIIGAGQSNSLEYRVTVYADGSPDRTLRNDQLYDPNDPWAGICG